MRLFSLCTFACKMIWPCITFDISLQNFKKLLDIFSPQIRKKTFLRIFSYNSGCKRKLCNRILEDSHIKAYLTELQSKYLLVPADKAGNNIIFVCRYYYVHTLMEELGINSGTNLNSTYVTQDPTVDEIIQTYATTLEGVFDIKLQ